MKDLVIKNSAIKREIIIWCISFVIAIAVNIYAITKYDTPLGELLTQLHIVVLLSILIYLLLLIIRGFVKTLLKIIKLLIR